MLSDPGNSAEACAEIHRLLSSGSLSRLLDSCRSMHLDLSASPLMPAFANACLPVAEVQRWIAEHSDSSVARPPMDLAPGSVLTVPGVIVNGVHAHSPRAPPPRVASLSVALEAEAQGTAMALAGLSRSNHALALGGGTSPELSRTQAEQMLVDLERRAVQWAQQASAMRGESRMLRSAATVDHSRLQSIERILLSTVEDLQRSHDARRVETTAEQDHATATKERKKARRQNHRYEQKSWFSKHELDPYPNGEEKLALARFTNRRKRHWRATESDAAGAAPAQGATTEQGEEEHAGVSDDDLMD
ncbi:hypothetical protein EMIHUDRAFT_236129 [Emiliania huxleyi CCMP1516]|uniref:CHHC U11-48K-type domain-containing protein n=2 Tax=Emiliania huxleyi TaxID=2903 RepID=A0A0D3JU56_EMIH1|nr:hypothetical protein EMIHUDRAFT_236129 [Emiliania huxleyi CCMP1516]EOD27041.1 hypothetical protein EMIHUDRAFT_236129 [Emiliania huxleyi CCMP1516]|eukprot:XP_005779470.1 hypothetical protein EMIHUDRAFT_236129 [Emiliania huxleyi CCMP1516]